MKPRQQVVTIHTGDYLDQLEHLRRRHQAAQEAGKDADEGPRRGGQATARSKADDLADEYNALVVEADATATHVRVQALGRRRWDALVEAHPPREDPATSEAHRKSDADTGVNEKTFPESLVPDSICDVSEGVEVKAWADFSEGERVDFLDGLASVDFTRLYLTAFALNRRVSADPKPFIASSGNRVSDAT